MGRIVVQGQPRQKVRETPVSANSWLQWFVPVIPAMWELEIRRIMVQAGLGPPSISNQQPKSLETPLPMGPLGIFPILEGLKGLTPSPTAPLPSYPGKVPPLKHPLGLFPLQTYGGRSMSPSD
jgi:hypothetical protein